MMLKQSYKKLSCIFKAPTNSAMRVNHTWTGFQFTANTFQVKTTYFPCWALLPNWASAFVLIDSVSSADPLRVLVCFATCFNDCFRCLIGHLRPLEQVPDVLKFGQTSTWSFLHCKSEWYASKWIPNTLRVVLKNVANVKSLKVLQTSVVCRWTRCRLGVGREGNKLWISGLRNSCSANTPTRNDI